MATAANDWADLHQGMVELFNDEYDRAEQIYLSKEVRVCECVALWVAVVGGLAISLPAPCRHHAPPPPPLPPHWHAPLSQMAALRLL